MISSERITFDPNVMGGRPCIRGMRVTVGTVVGLIAGGSTAEEILVDYPYLEPEDIPAALSYAAGKKQVAAGCEPVAARKPRPNHQRTLQIFRAMTPRQKLAQVFKLNERTLKLFRVGLHRRFPELDAAAFEQVYLQMRERCHNRNY
ncbi:MAG: DUF433 domain-containing protein [Planctomycetaceae bacterium]|nr:DUF433 domain-containing protein [Planctomycetaceae bacterium]